MKYLIQVDNQLHGYEDPRILQIDILYQSPDNYQVFKRDESRLRIGYSPISAEELRNDAQAYEQALAMERETI